ncbi:MAG: HD domain-containing phosphohydrolase, partial [Bacilli bacterium]
KNMCYLTFNKFHAASMKLYYGIDIKEGMNFIDCISDAKFQSQLKNEIELTLLGQERIVQSEIILSPGKYYETLYTPLFDRNKEIIGVTVFSHDVTSRKKSEEAITYLSYHDPLTGLKNRRYYQEELERLEKAPFFTFTFVLFDINGLKIMNDAFGHQMGDELLKKVADLTKKIIPQEFPFMRIGGDEFVFILYNTLEKDGLKFVDQCRSILEKETLGGMTISVSFGVEERKEGNSINETIKKAEMKMYRNKLFEVSSSRNEAIRTILNTLHVKNKREEFHSKRVSFICQKIGQMLMLRKEEISLLKLMGNLHDIGKIAIDDAILNKPTKLTDEEWNEIKRHPEIGYRILLTSPDYAEIAEDILAHHERWDGKGYPRGLKGNDIPLRARIIAIADAYDAMTSSRPYRSALSKQYAMDEVKKNAGTQFDPDIALKFVKTFEDKEI